MNNQFDELTKAMAQSVTRRAALKKFGLGLAGMALACFGLANKAEAGPRQCSCVTNADCSTGDICSASGTCLPSWCNTAADPCCCSQNKTNIPSCDPSYFFCKHHCQQIGVYK